MKVDETGQDEEARGLEDPRSGGAETVAELGHDAVLEEQIEEPVASRDRVEQSAPAHEKRRVHPGSPSHACPVRSR